MEVLIIDPLLGLVAVMTLVALNAIFVAGEFSLVAVDVERVEVMADGGHRRARIMRKLLSRLSFHLGGAQLGITVTSLLLGLIAEDAIGALLDYLPGVTLSGRPGLLRLSLSPQLFRWFSVNWLQRIWPYLVL